MTAATIANGWDGLYAAITMPRKSDATPDEQAALEKRVEAGEWLRIGDAAKVLGISRSKLDLLLRASKIGYRLEPGSKYRKCNPADIKRLLAESRQEIPSAAQADNPHHKPSS